MAFLTTVLNKIKKLFLILFMILKKPFVCCRRRSRRNSGMILPMTVDHKQTKSSDNINQFHPMANEWTPSQLMSNSMNFSINGNKNNYHSNDPSVPRHLNHNSVMNSSEEQESETDFFRDMVPEFRKPKKIVLSTNQSNDNQMSNRFGVDIKATIFQTQELGVIDHFEDGAGSWEDNAAEQEMLDTDESLRHVRQQERERRIAEHKRIKLEKEFKRSKQPKGNLLATKIS